MIGPNIVARINQAAAQATFEEGVQFAVCELEKAMHGGEDELLRCLLRLRGER